MEENRRQLAEHFARKLLELAPESVLDVGCGRGDLLSACGEQGVFAVGVEAAQRDGLQAAVAGGILVARAEHLPFRTGSFNWVAMRHVPHHLEDLKGALAEAWRVARRGLLIAEPWYDMTRTPQRFGLRADRLLKRFDRRRGLYHADVLGEDELLAGLPVQQVQHEVETVHFGGLWTRADFEAEADQSMGGLLPIPEDELEYNIMREVAEKGSLALSGSLILSVYK